MIFLYTPLLSSQENSAQEIYQSRKMQADVLIGNIFLSDSLVIQLIEEAEYFADQHSYELAIDFLDQAINLVLETPSIEPQTKHSTEIGPDMNIVPADHYSNRWQTDLEAGTDYSRSEYELSFIETDSVILEEIHHPYTAIRLSRNNIQGNRFIDYYGYGRIDRSLMQASLALSTGNSNIRNNWRFNSSSDLFWLLDENSGNFWENEIGFFFSRHYASSRSIQLSTNWRYKFYFPVEETYQDLLDGRFQFVLRQTFSWLHWAEILLQPSLYRESRIQGLRYYQIQITPHYQYMNQYNQYIDLTARFYYRNFESNDYGGGKYNSIQPRIETETPLVGPFGIQLFGEWERRLYGQPNLIYPDFHRGSFEIQGKLYLSPLLTFGTGYLYEYESNRVDSPEEQDLAMQENFKASGWVISIDWTRLDGTILSIAFRHSNRDYPHAGSQDFLGIYTNRRVFSIQGLGYFPLSRSWKFQFFINYDGDRDRDRDNNDHFTTIFNAGFVYSF